MTQLDGEAVREVATLAGMAKTVQRERIGEYEFSDRPLVRLNLDPALPTTLEFYTLGGFVRYVLAETETVDALIHVVNPRLVEAISKLEGPDNNLRRVYARAVFQRHAASRDEGFELNSYGALGDLVIALQCAFAPDTGDIQALVKFCAAVRQTASVGVGDDGVSQTVEAKRGVAAVMETPVKNPWVLAPFRTFSEIDQPGSPFVLRFRSGYDAGSQLPQAALFETGNERWVIDAVQAIAKYLRVQLPGHEVLG